MSQFNSIEEIVEDIKLGKMVILVDDEDRENEGDIIIAADFIHPQSVNFMATEARGLICLAMPQQQINKLGLSLMVKEEYNQSQNGTAFTLSIEASEGVSTGISASDRARTISVASRPNVQASDISVPGHIFPIRAQEGGVLKRAGHTEASVDLCILAGLNPSAAICEIMNPDGTMARVPDLMIFAKKHNLKIGTIKDLIQYRIETETFVKEVAEMPLDTSFGEGFKLKLFQNELDGSKHIAIVKGQVNGPDGLQFDSESPVLVRVQTENVVGDVFENLNSPSKTQIKTALAEIDKEGVGVLLYLRLESMDDRLISRVQSFADALTDKPVKTKFQRDKKDYGIGAQILRSLGVRKIELLANRQPEKVGMKGYGLELISVRPLGPMEAPIKANNNEEEFFEEVENAQ